MKIIIAGSGKVGQTLAKQLSAEGHDLTIIDRDISVVESAVERFDAMAVSGNCATGETLEKAGVLDADLLIAATGEDELNLLCCMTAHGMNENLHTIARVRTPEYAQQVLTMPHVFPLSFTVNPEQQAALEVERLLKYPGFLRRDTFAKGQAELVELRIEDDSPLKDIPLSSLSTVTKCRVLICAVVRSGEAVAPSGNFVLRQGDRIYVTAPTSTLSLLLKNLGVHTRRVRKVLICGGGRVSYYLAHFLSDEGMDVTVLDKNRERCVELADLLPTTNIVHGDCSSQRVLESQGIAKCDAVVAATGIDETNMIISLYADNCGIPQIITKVSRGVSSTIADSLNLGSVICPKELCCNDIIRYVRAMQCKTGAAVTVHTIADGQAEAVEFLLDGSAKHCNTPLKQLKLKPNVLIAGITHGANHALPTGDSTFCEGDTVVVVTPGRGKLQQFNDIFA